MEGESDTADNCSAAIRVTVIEPATSDGPNLVVSASVDNVAPAPGGAFTLSATVTNAGDSAAAATTLSYYLSSDAEISTSDAFLGSDPVDALAASGTSAQSMTLTAPGDPDTYYYGACADAVEGESDTADNCSPPVGVEVARTGTPNLVVVMPAVDNMNPEEGGSFTLSATAKNVGDGASPATTLRYLWSPNPRITWWSDTRQGSAAVAALPASGTSAHSESLTALTPGTYYYGACVDRVEGESSTFDNCSSSVLTEVAHKRGPDLVVEATVDIEEPNPGDEFTLSLTVTNIGDWQMPYESALGFYLSTEDVHIDTSDTLEGTASVPILGISESSTHSIRVTAPTGRSWPYRYGGCVDRVNGEPDILHNCSKGRPVMVSYPPAGIDLSVHGTNVDTENPRVGEPLSLSVTVRNRGAETSTGRALTLHLCNCWTNSCSPPSYSTHTTEIAEHRIAPLSAKEERVYTTTTTTPGLTGAYTYIVLIESDSADTNPDNECGHIHVTNSE